MRLCDLKIWYTLPLIYFSKWECGVLFRENIPIACMDPCSGITDIISRISCINMSPIDYHNIMMAEKISGEAERKCQCEYKYSNTDCASLWSWNPSISSGILPKHLEELYCGLQRTNSHRSSSKAISYNCNMVTNYRDILCGKLCSISDLSWVLHNLRQFPYEANVISSPQLTSFHSCSFLK